MIYPYLLSCSVHNIPLRSTITIWINLDISKQNAIIDIISRYLSIIGYTGAELGCLIPPLLFQTYFASISFGHLWFQDTQKHHFFPEFFSLRSPQDPHFCFKLILQVSHLVTYNFRIPKT